MNHEWAKKYYCNGRTFHFQELRCSQQMKLPVLNAFIRAWELYYRWYRAGYDVVGIEDERKLLLDPPLSLPSPHPRFLLRGSEEMFDKRCWDGRGDQWQSCSHAELGTAAYICCMIFIRRWPQARCNGAKCASIVCYTELSQCNKC